MTAVADNGVNVQALLDAREVLKGAPEAAQFTWRASSKWQGGVHTDVTVQDFFYNIGLRKENRVVFSFRLNGIGTFGTEQIGQRFR